MTPDPELKGLPDGVATPLLEAAERSGLRWLGRSLYTAVLILGFLFGWKVIYPALTFGARDRASDLAWDVSGFFITTDAGLSLIAGVFVWIVLAIIPSAAIVRRIPMPHKAAFYLGLRRQTEIEAPAFMRRWSEGVEPAQGDTSDKALATFIDARMGAVLRKGLTRSAPAALLLLLPFFWLDMRHFTVLSDQGVHQSGLFDPGVTLQDWDDVSGVDLGCNKGKDGGSLIYEVRFSGGKKHRLPNSGTYSGTGWFEALERVDALLSDGDVHFRRWSWLNRDPLHPACLAHHRELYGTKRIDSLLRIGNL